MGCGSNSSIKEVSDEKETVNAFIKVKNSIKAYKEAISEYKKNVEEFGDILEKKLICEKDITYYFKLQKRINLEKEPKEIKEFKQTFNRVNRLEKRLNIGPGIIKKYQEEYKKNKEKNIYEKKENLENNDNETEDDKIDTKAKKRKK